MRRGRVNVLQYAALLTLASCAQTGELSIRVKPTGLAAGEHPVSYRVAEARGQFALGNVALALEGYRKALRENPISVDAMNGIAACYDRMGRFDLSRRYYELALAVDPGDRRLYANLALSLELQGRADEAERVRAELANLTRAGSQETALAAAAAEPIEHPVGSGLATLPAASVTVVLPPPTPVAEHRGSARLQRLSLAEVALVTSGTLRLQPKSSEHRDKAALTSTGRAPVGKLILLNAARSDRLAARTRALLQRTGLPKISIGDAPQVQRHSAIAYPQGRRADAVKIASRLAFPLQHRPGSSQAMVIYLGRDAASAMMVSHR